MQHLPSQVLIKDSVSIKPILPVNTSLGDGANDSTCYRAYYSINLTGSSIAANGSANIFFGVVPFIIYSCNSQVPCYPAGSATGFIDLNDTIGDVSIDGLGKPLKAELAESPFFGDIQTVIVSDPTGKILEGLIHLKYNPNRPKFSFVVPDSLKPEDIYAWEEDNAPAPVIFLKSLVNGIVDSVSTMWDVGNPFNTADSFNTMIAGETKTFYVRGSIFSACGEEFEDYVPITLRKIKSVDHFQLLFRPTVIERGDTVQVRVQALDNTGQELNFFEFSGDALLSIEVDSSTYGHFEMVDAIIGKKKKEPPQRRVSKEAQLMISGNKTAQGNAFLVPYYLANAGGLYFIADGNGPAETSYLHFMVTHSTAQGFDSLLIKSNALPIELVVLDPVPNGEVRKEISKIPVMPAITAKATLKNYTGGTVTFYWKLTVQWENNENYNTTKRLIKGIYTGTTTASGSGVSSWTVDWKNEMRGGTDVILEVTVIAGGETYKAVIDKPYEILGMNPEIADVKEGLSIEEQVIVYLESKPKWKQFEKEFGFPIFGDPRGYGLFQLDRIGNEGRRATDDEIWNWRKNKETGKWWFGVKKTIAINFPKNIRIRTTLSSKSKYYLPQGYRGATDFDNNELLLKESFQLYNGGHYWFWKPKNPRNRSSSGEWIIAAKTMKWENEPYGIRAWTIYKQVVNAKDGIGTYPKNWN